VKTVVITGATGNLGIPTVQTFAKAGWQVVAIVSPGKLPSGSMSNVEFVEADLANESGTHSVIEKVCKKYAIDAACLLAGGFDAGGFDHTDDTALRKMYDLNFGTAWHVAGPHIQHMMTRESGGRIVFIGARPALDANAGKHLVAYGLSKALLFKLAEYINATGKLMANVMVFQALDTPLNRSSMPKADASKWVKPEDVARKMLKVLDGNEAMVVEM